MKQPIRDLTKKILCCSIIASLTLTTFATPYVAENENSVIMNLNQIFVNTVRKTGGNNDQR